MPSNTSSGRTARDPFDTTLSELRPVRPARRLAPRTRSATPTSAEHDYRVLQPFRMTDPNGNRAEVAFDTLGLVAGTAVMGKPPKPRAIPWPGFVPNLTPQQTRRLSGPTRGQRRRAPRDRPPPASSTTSTDPIARQPHEQQRSCVRCNLARETHVSDSAAARQTQAPGRLSSYSDGFGREIQKKIQAEPGPVPKRNADGQIIVGADGQPEMTPDDVSPPLGR